MKTRRIAVALVVCIALLVALALCVGLCGCKSDEEKRQEEYQGYFDEINESMQKVFEQEQISMKMKLTATGDDGKSDPVTSSLTVVQMDSFVSEFGTPCERLRIGGVPLYAFEDFLIAQSGREIKTVSWDEVPSYLRPTAKETMDKQIVDPLYEMPDNIHCTMTKRQQQNEVTYTLAFDSLIEDVLAMMDEDVRAEVKKAFADVKVNADCQVSFVVTDGLLTLQQITACADIDDTKVTLTSAVTFEYDADPVISDSVRTEYQLAMGTLHFVERVTPAEEGVGLPLADGGRGEKKYELGKVISPLNTVFRNDRYLLMASYDKIVAYDLDTLTMAYTADLRKKSTVSACGDGYVAVRFVDLPFLGYEIYSVADGSFVCRVADRPLALTQDHLFYVHEQAVGKSREKEMQVKVLDRNTKEEVTVDTLPQHKWLGTPVAYVLDQEKVLFVSISRYSGPNAYYGFDLTTGELLYNERASWRNSWENVDGDMVQAYPGGWRYRNGAMVRTAEKIAVDVKTGVGSQYVAPKYPPLTVGDKQYEHARTAADVGRYAVVTLHDTDGFGYFYLFDKQEQKYLCRLDDDYGEGLMLDEDTIFLFGAYFAGLIELN